ncbi:hypothetical protein J6C36_01435, partial [Methanocorpusculaceae archaeon]|nr:hypothetical protein [Methanocorpusculaceae archaeon]
LRILPSTKICIYIRLTSKSISLPDRGDAYTLFFREEITDDFPEPFGPAKMKNRFIGLQNVLLRCQWFSA